MPIEDVEVNGASFLGRPCVDEPLQRAIRGAVDRFAVGLEPSADSAHIELKSLSGRAGETRMGRETGAGALRIGASAPAAVRGSSMTSTSNIDMTIEPLTDFIVNGFYGRFFEH